jgi:hypothetical protein
MTEDRKRRDRLIKEVARRAGVSPEEVLEWPSEKLQPYLHDMIAQAESARELPNMARKVTEEGIAALEQAQAGAPATWEGSDEIALLDAIIRLINYQYWCSSMPHPAKLAVATVANEGEPIGMLEIAEVPSIDVLLSDLNSLLGYLRTYAMFLEHLRDSATPTPE